MPEGLHLTLAMTFPDLANPDSVLAGVQLLDAEYPGLFRWMGEVNLVKQALFDNGHEPVPAATIAEWAGFMELLRDRGILSPSMPILAATTSRHGTSR